MFIEFLLPSSAPRIPRASEYLLSKRFIMDDFPSSPAKLLEQKLMGKQRQDPSLAMNTPSSIPAKTAMPKSYAAALRGPRPAPGPTPLTVGALSRLNGKNLEEELRVSKSWSSKGPAPRIKEWVCRIRDMQNGRELLRPENSPRLK